MKTVVLHRKIATNSSTIGELVVDGHKFYTLEDPRREHKVWGETRIPAGRYVLDLRNEGGMTQRYAKRWPDMHQGMIWLRNVPMFEWIYIHVGNSPKDTEGCILVGMKRGDNIIYQSRMAYELIYPKLAKAIRSEGCAIEIYDEEPL